MTENNKAKRRARNLVIDIATLFVIVVVAIIIFAVVGQSHTETTGNEENVTLVNLYCSLSSPDNQFLDGAPIPTSGLHEVRANFRQDSLVDIMYSFTATYPDSSNLETTRNRLQANFNLAYGNKLVYSDNVWTATFPIIEDSHQAKMTVYTEANSLKSSNAVVFQLPANQPVPDTIESMKSAYKAAGFSCQVSE